MANQEQLAILRQGVDVWNEWREENPHVEIDLREADLNEANLSGVNFRQADLFGARLGKANLSHANLSGANLWLAYLNGADLTKALLGGANLSVTELVDANLRGAELTEADFTNAHLSNTNFRDAYFWAANLTRAGLAGAILQGAWRFEDSDFSNATLDGTVLGDIDLSEAKGLEDIVHRGPSTIGTDTLLLSKGKIPEAFLRGCGLSDADIEYAKLSDPDLDNEEKSKILYKIYDLRASQAIQISPLFISYSHSDSAFVDKLEISLNKKGVRFWRDIHNMKSGRMEKQINRAMRLNPTVLLILSKDSLQSDWVEHEVRTAHTLEKEMKRDVLCPVAVDDSWKNSPWPKRIMEQVTEYSILDFSEWKDDTKFESTFNKLIDGLELFYK